MSNDKKDNSVKPKPAPAQPSPRPAKDSRNHWIEFAEDFRKSHTVQNSLPAPDPIKKK